MRIGESVRRRGSTFVGSAPEPPGYISGIPYLLLLRWLIPGAVLLRASLEPQGWWGAMSGTLAPAAGLLASAAAGTFLIRAPGGDGFSTPRQSFHILADIGLISWVFVATGSTHSLFFLFYILPSLAAAEYLSPRATLVTTLFIAFAFGCVLYLIYWHDPGRPDVNTLWTRVYLARAVCFLVIGSGGSLIVRLSRFQRFRLRRQADHIEALTNFETEASSRFSANEILALALTTAMEQTSAEGGEVWSLD